MGLVILADVMAPMAQAIVLAEAANLQVVSMHYEHLVLIQKAGAPELEQRFCLISVCS